MTNEPSPRPWRCECGPTVNAVIAANGAVVVPHTGYAANARLIVDSVNWFSEEQRDAMIEATKERDKLKAECDRLRTAYADLWRAVKRIEADSRRSLGTGLEVASSALHYVQTYASSAIRAAEKKGFAPAIGEDKP